MADADDNHADNTPVTRLRKAAAHPSHFNPHGAVGGATVLSSSPSAKSALSMQVISPTGQGGAIGGAVETTSKSKRVVRKGSFRVRNSLLDTDHLMAPSNVYRGFFVLFWVTIILFLAGESANYYLKHGIPFSLKTAHMMFGDFMGWLWLDAWMCVSMVWVFIAQKIIIHGWFPLELGFLLQHVIQTLWFAYFTIAVYSKDWPWIPSGSLCIHFFIMLMKGHSYMSTNIELGLKKRRQQALAEEKIIAQVKSVEISPEQHATLDALNRDLTKGLGYPANVNAKEFVHYLFVPTLVYEMEYPRSPVFRPLYFLEKTMVTFGAIVILYIHTEHFIYPVLNEINSIGLVELFARLVAPFIIGYLLVFIILFEGFCNASAELTYFSDREFYSDWWNSTSFDEYARKWNKPVHEFLLRHVYLESIETYKLPKDRATFLTFFLSSCFHEFIMAVIGKRVRWYLFFMQMSQVPLIYFSRMKVWKRYPVAGNAFFWFGMVLGPPLLAIAYCREHYNNTDVVP